MRVLRLRGRDAAGGAPGSSRDNLTLAKHYRRRSDARIRSRIKTEIRARPYANFLGTEPHVEGGEEKEI